MKQKFLSISVPLLMVIVVCLIAGCDYEGPEAIWNPDKSLGAAPEITAISPAGRAEAGILEISLTCKNFTPDSTNWVYFDNQKALIKSLSGDRITVYRPSLSGDSISVKVMTEGAYTFAEYKGYGVAESARLYGKLASKNLAQVIAVDKTNDNLYMLQASRDIFQINTNEDKVAFGRRSFSQKATDMKVGPDGGLYLQAGKTNALYRVPPEGGGAETAAYATFIDKINYFDFDNNGNIFGAGDKTGLNVITKDLAAKNVGGNCKDLTVIWLRVFNNFVYVASETGIWRCAILGADGSVGDKEKVMDISDIPAYAKSKIISFDLSEDGVLYIGTTHDDAVFLYYQDGRAEQYYKGILPTNGGQLTWGGGTYLYLNMNQDVTTNDILRMDTGKKEVTK
jgi:hypothetical protein